MPVTFKTNNLERMRLTPAGNFGIGTINPQAKLDVNGSVKLRSSLQLPSILEFTTIPDYILVIDKNGNVTKQSYSAFKEPKAPQKPFTICEMQNPDGSFGLLDPMWRSGLNKLYSECSNVYIGIGTTTPRVNLDVQGTTFSNKIAIGNINPNTISAYLHLKTNSSSITNTSTVFLIESPIKKLMQLNNQGLLQVREVKVDLISWPDYVFEKEYDLKSLKQVEKFIQKEGHLPNVPTAKEVIENGANLGEMNKILLEKVEELTLYLIQQEKRIEVLENSIKEGK